MDLYYCTNKKLYNYYKTHKMLIPKRALCNNRDVFLNILLLVLLCNVMKLFTSFIWLVIINLFPKNEALSNVKGIYLCLSELVTGQNITGVESLILMKPNV